MQSHLKALDKLRSLYAVLTHLHELSLGQANAAALEVETQIDKQKATVRRSSIDSLTALSHGDTPNWMIYESQRKFIALDAARLIALRQQREEELLCATEVYQENRMQLEQMQSVLDSTKANLKREHVRKEQSFSDDLFLSRQRWLQQRAARRMNRR